MLALPLFHSVQSRRIGLVLAFILSLTACASGVTPAMKRLPDRVELNSVPFFRGNVYQSGPGTLAAMLSQQGVIITPGLLDKPLQLPGREANLEQNMQNLAREYGFMVYPLDGELDALLTQVSAGFPVMLRITEGSAWWSKPRYALLIGYNRNKQTVLLHAGMDRRVLMSFSSFTSAWKDAGHWAVLIQGPRQLPAQVDQQRWLNAAKELAQAGQEQAAGEATKALKAQ
ncbi:MULTISPECIES: peptidase C39 family protein [unclassified Pseudomonas]|uniref:peptidase C39 family protein n=1 Tax=unclassified Pseudomonas TaxID=196821 RepID=UPI002AC93B89|nr:MULTISPECIES: peptidase C39 family protein [unclassified Pseudomonas]MEB0039826.1 peptidase C39 family protein [Pseudomonas sp. MH10]MEB0077232.1 peptidase C39 family protein [Pseudomonas sp. MH10out]MEB0091437.1 peptidase C39 family protein [Pseudomonas sp. CCI4.2]MEB0101579.1 peptidase C39 family protein [Pseudomonas sp. CCI3.2]MEB0120689.1 peptidase C39 family protein [Pseudomonas sp. CCI1.2]